MAIPDGAADSVAPDIWGDILFDHHRGKKAEYKLVFKPHHEVVYQADEYFSESFLDHELEALRYCNGRVLDVGCGAGRHLLWLAKKGMATTGIDVSPKCVRICRERGAPDVRQLSVFECSSLDGCFDVAILMGNNVGLGGTVERTRAMISQIANITAPGGWLIISFVPMDYVPDHECLEEGVQFTHRLEYDGRAGPYFDWLFLRTAQLQKLVEGVGYDVHRKLRGVDVQSYLIARRSLDGFADHIGVPDFPPAGGDVLHEAIRDRLNGADTSLELQGLGRLPDAAFDLDRILADEPTPAEAEALEMATGRVLVMGCGAGGIVNYLSRKGLDVWGNEPCQAAVEAAHARGLDRVRQAEFANLPYGAGAFDTIVILQEQLGRPGDLPGSRDLLKAVRTLGTSDATLITSYGVAQQTFPATVRCVRAGRAGEWFLWTQFESDAHVSQLVKSAGWRPVGLFENSATEHIMVAQRNPQVVRE